MNANEIFALTRRLIDVESVSGNEAAVGECLLQELRALGCAAETMPVEGSRFNIYATTAPAPRVVFSTHIDTVPPFSASREDAANIYGRGACDAKGIIAAMIAAADRLRAEGLPVGMLFVVGEERDSLGAKVANQRVPQPAPRFLINGEPTENRIAVASKGALRVALTATGKMAHSAYPHLGESAIEKLLEGLQRVRALVLPSHPDFGPTTMNIGLISGGRAPNVIPDRAQAQLLYRLIGPPDAILAGIHKAVAGSAEAEVLLHIPFVKLRTFAELPTFIAAYTTDIPALSGWGEPILIGPGSIHVAHTDAEFIAKQELLAAVDIYSRMARELVSS